jgi:hypothetical protein
MTRKAAAALIVLFGLIGLGYNYLFGASEDRVRSSEKGIAMPSPSSGTFNINSDSPSISVSTIADAERASRDLINQAGHSCDVVTSLSPIGWVESGGSVHRAKCSNGEQYAVVLSDENRLRFLSSCAVFTESTGEQC